MNHRTFLVIDYETTSANPYTTQPIQLAAVAIDARKMDIKPNSEFETLIKPVMDDEECARLGLDRMQEGAAKVHGITEEKLIDAPSPKDAWANFAEYVNQYNFRGTDFTAPIATGYNIKNFDNVITTRLCSEEPYNFGPKSDKFPRGNLLHPIHSIDMMDFMFMFFENNKDVNSVSADRLIRGYMGYSKGQAHDALSDVVMTAELFCRVGKMLRKVCGGRKFEGAFV